MSSTQISGPNPKENSNDALAQRIRELEIELENKSSDYVKLESEYLKSKHELTNELNKAKKNQEYWQNKALELKFDMEITRANLDLRMKEHKGKDQTLKAMEKQIEEYMTINDSLTNDMKTLRSVQQSGTDGITELENDNKELKEKLAELQEKEQTSEDVLRIMSNWKLDSLQKLLPEIYSLINTQMAASMAANKTNTNSATASPGAANNMGMQMPMMYNFPMMGPQYFMQAGASGGFMHPMMAQGMIPMNPGAMMTGTTGSDGSQPVTGAQFATFTHPFNANGSQQS